MFYNDNSGGGRRKQQIGKGKIGCECEREGNASLGNFKHFTFNKDNYPYAQPLDRIGSTDNRQKINQGEREMNNYRVGSRHTYFIDSVVVDYKQKTFQLMRKNAELQLSIKQYRNDVSNLEKEVSQLTQLTQQIFQLIGNGQLEDNCNQYENISVINVLQQQQNDDLGYEQGCRQSQAKQIIQKLNRSKQCSNSSLQNNAQISANLNSTMKQNKLNAITSNRASNMQTKKKKYNNIGEIPSNTTNAQNNQLRIEQESCNCQQNYNNIITQYKKMVESLHAKIVKKEKNIELLKQQLQNCNKLISEYSSKIKELKEEQLMKNKNIKQLEEKVEEYESRKQQHDRNTQKLKKLQQQYRNINEKYQLVLKLSEQKDQSLQWLIQENDEIGRQKQKLKQKYKQEFNHFQEMSKMVQQKLIEVEYEMNFYKKERNQNFQKIVQLERELKQYKGNQEKKYYSFGDNQENAEVQVGSFEVEEKQKKGKNKEMGKEEHQHQRIDEEIDKKKGDSTNYVQSGKNTMQLCRQSGQQKSMQESPKTEIKQKQSWQIQCYQQSIKTLLEQNNRLKNSLLKLYNYQKEQGNLGVISKQIELEIKILISTMPNQLQESKEYESCGTVKKG